jgi:hypothetical protein
MYLVNMETQVQTVKEPLHFHNLVCVNQFYWVRVILPDTLNVSSPITCKPSQIPIFDVDHLDYCNSEGLWIPNYIFQAMFGSRSFSRLRVCFGHDRKHAATPSA